MPVNEKVQICLAGIALIKNDNLQNRLKIKFYIRPRGAIFEKNHFRLYDAPYSDHTRLTTVLGVGTLPRLRISAYEWWTVGRVDFVVLFRIAF